MPPSVSASNTPAVDLVGKASPGGSSPSQPSLLLLLRWRLCRASWGGGCTVNEQEAQSHLEPEDFGCARPNGADLPGQVLVHTGSLFHIGRVPVAGSVVFPGQVEKDGCAGEQKTKSQGRKKTARFEALKRSSSPTYCSGQDPIASLARLNLLLQRSAILPANSCHHWDAASANRAFALPCPPDRLPDFCQLL